MPAIRKKRKTPSLKIAAVAPTATATVSQPTKTRVSIDLNNFKVSESPNAKVVPAFPAVNKKNYFLVIGLTVLAVVGVVIGLKIKKFGSGSVAQKPAPKIIVVHENLVAPDTRSYVPANGRQVAPGAVAVPIVTTTEIFVVPGADITLKESYDLALTEGVKWSSDAKLSNIISAGAVTVSGKSSQWQIIFGSKILKKGFVVVVRGKQIFSGKEIDSSDPGHDAPKNWYDAGGAISAMAALPQFNDAAVSAVSFYFNTDDKLWEYGIVTSKGTTAMPVK